jgi:hypothetical protein
MLDDVNRGGLVIEIDLNLTTNRNILPKRLAIGPGYPLGVSERQQEFIAVARFDRVGVKVVTTEFIRIFESQVSSSSWTNLPFPCCSARCKQTSAKTRIGRARKFLSVNPLA